MRKSEGKSMKRLSALLCAVVMLFALSACNSNSNTTEDSTTPALPQASESISETEPVEALSEPDTILPDTEPEPAEAITEDENTESRNIEPSDEAVSGKVLIVYFSRTGNTETIANMITEQTEGTVFRIIPAVPYPENYNECLEIAKEEIATDARPELSSSVDNIDDYDTIFIGYPIWGGSCPKVILTFLEAYDLTGKTIIPFCTHGGGGAGTSAADIGAACPQSSVLTLFSISGGSVNNAQEDVSTWLSDLSF